MESSDLSISIALCLQSIELFGKAILRAFDVSKCQLRGYKGHPVVQITEDAQNKVLNDSRTRSLAHARFMNQLFHVGKLPFSPPVTMESALKSLMPRGEAFGPRDYFYPDHENHRAFARFPFLTEIAAYVGQSAVEVGSALEWFEDSESE